MRRSDVVQGRRFSEQLGEAINRYTNRALTTAETIVELVLEQAEQYALAA